MVKSLNELRQQKAKLLDLKAPPESTKPNRDFVAKHVVVLHPDPAGNEDDVFKAKRVKRSKRAPDHGYEPGKDEEVYEGTYKDVDTDQKELRLRRNRAAHADRNILGDQGMKDTEGTHFAQAQSDFDKAHGDGLRKWPGFVKAERSRRSNAKLRLTTNSYEPEGNELDEAKLTPESHAAVWLVANPKRAQRTIKSFSRHMGKAGFVHYDTRPFKKGIDLGYDQVVSNQNNLLRGLLPHSFGEDYEHIAALSESDQSLLVDTYNSLNEANQDHFLELIETQEGVDEILDFAITNKGFR